MLKLSNCFISLLYRRKLDFDHTKRGKNTVESITIKDIAKALNLSTSTVSRALRDSSEMNLETKKMVLEYARQMNYSPNPMAVSLRENKSKAIGVILPEIANSFFSQLINGVEEVAYEQGYHVVIFQSHESYEREVANLKYLASRRVDGMLVSLSSLTTDLHPFHSLIEKGMPFVFFDRVPASEKVHTITSDNYQSSYNATKHLLINGKKRIAHLTSPRYLSITTERLEGYRRALIDHDIPYDENLIKFCHYGGAVAQENEQTIRDLLSLPHPPDGILAASDRLTMGCLEHLHKNNIRIPEEIAIVGFTNMPVAGLLDPPLTAVVQPAAGMGKRATELLIQLIESPDQIKGFQHISLPSDLQVRRSSASYI